MTSLSCFKAYDIRGKQPEELNPTLAYHLGAALATVLPSAKTAMLGMDSRATSPQLLAAFAAGLAGQSVACQSLGLCGTEEVYHAAGSGACGVGIMVTASHNPIEYNGFKVAKHGGEPLDLAQEFAAWQQATLARLAEPAPESFPAVPTVSLRAAYVNHLLGLINPANIPAQKIVINAGNGAAGPTADAILARLPQLDVVRVHHEPDGTFPNGIPNPLLVENRASTANAVKAANASLGVAWDGDFDRCFFYDGQGNFISSYYIATFMAEAVLARHPGAPIVLDPRLYWATQAAVEGAGGSAHFARVGHGFIKPKMRELNSPFAGEISSHFYFREFFTCDSGMLPMLLLLELLGKRGQTLAQAVGELQRTFPAGEELNFRTPTPAKQYLAALEPQLLAMAPAHERLDGLSLTHQAAGWRANIRGSSNEPLLRLNVEARSSATLQQAEHALVAAILAAGATAEGGH
ncbi:MAG: phosphomannomutase [Alphaproteobacteria bacterium]|nr:phosphomannomutase [Alphaproteobacteria bacterium]